MKKMAEWVCAWCDVYNRIECEARDKDGSLVSSWTKCAYCGRCELGPKRGHQTPIPPDNPPPDPNVPC
jgi:hypothetical protein